MLAQRLWNGEPHAGAGAGAGAGTLVEVGADEVAESAAAKALHTE